MKVLKILDRIVEKISKGVASVTPVIVVVLMLLMVIDILLRTIFTKSVLGTYEIVENGIGVAAFLTLAMCTYQGRHVKVDSVTSKLPKRAAAWLEAILSLVPLCVLPLLAWRGFVRTANAIETRETSTILSFPIWPFVLVMAICFCIAELAQIDVVVKNFVKAVAKENE